MKKPIKAKIGDEIQEIEDYELPEGFDLVKTDEVISKEDMNNIVQSRVNEVKEKTAAELKSNESFNRMLEERGFTFDDTGLVVPLDDGKAKDAKIALYKRWQEAEMLPEIEKRDQTIETTTNRLRQYIDRDLDRQLSEAARELGVKDEYIRPLSSGRTPLYYELREGGNLKYFEDEDQWLQADDDSDGYRLKHGKPVGVRGVLESFKSDESKSWLFADQRRKSANVSTRRPGEAADYEDPVVLNRKLEKGEMTPEEYMERRRPRIR